MHNAPLTRTTTTQPQRNHNAPPPRLHACDTTPNFSVSWWAALTYYDYEYNTSTAYNIGYLVVTPGFLDFKTAGLRVW